MYEKENFYSLYSMYLFFIMYSPNLMHYHIWLSGGRRAETHAWFVS